MSIALINIHLNKAWIRKIKYFVFEEIIIIVITL